MSEWKVPAKGRTTGLVKALYVIAAVIAVIFVYMIIANAMYMKNYLASYGMTFSDMWMDATQYVITGSISYLVYAILIFCAGKIISMLSTKAEAAGDAEEEAAPPAAEEAAEEDPAEETAQEPAEEETVEEEAAWEPVDEPTEAEEVEEPTEELETEETPAEEPEDARDAEETEETEESEETEKAEEDRK